jgi:hypothetical protein
VAFGKRGAQEEIPDPVPTVDWAGVRKFTIGTVERPVTANRTRRVRGPWAIRVPKGQGEKKVFAPCAYVAAAAPPAPPSAMNSCLYEDAEAQRLLCYLVEEEGEGGERRFRAHDGKGEDIGVIRRIPPSQKIFKHTWRMEQPEHPEIVGRNEWVSGGATGIALRVTGKAVGGALESLFADENTEVGKRRQSRKLEWWSGNELVMISQSIKLLEIQTDWLDRRLAFAFAVLGDR